MVAALATVGLWTRSHFIADAYMWPVQSGGRGFELIDSRYVETAPGRLVFRERTVVM